MTIRVAINGYGRIGRNVLRALYESEKGYPIKIVAINDLGDASINAHLTKYDSVHGRFNAKVEHDEEAIYVNEDKIKTFSERDPAKLPWAELNVDVVFECTGIFTSKEAVQPHLNAGAKKVIISAPGKNVDATVVYGVNNNEITADMTVISNASCTTNCLAPFAKPLNDEIGIESGLMTTIHAYTNDQRLSDVYHTDLRRARAAAMSMIPTKTGAAAAVGLVVPELAGKFDGLAVRVPTVNVSLVDLSFIAARDTTVEEINAIIEKAASVAPMSEVLAVNKEPLVSIDFNHNPYSSNFDATQTRVNGRLVKVMAWYDNEWGFSNRMLDNAVALMTAK
ncbi:type I glyceraldehyde-3-phosphate dehydrogenase [Shewanella colwelliana]|uniref:Glyceraldehyde-3-phosphate dehydrogenase n=1 Tax=Shewanella colwelliana TaxID=23 RepID=A0A1E5IZ06_SHECO|nr:type I glyceraldehyde-3-phosphate dehydrogenase [Shewanella colwelliana]MCZ4339551.1 type I glyceraldehyde-3-phosphate dehydrogenase [Shewanella colwelliana]MDX1282348.1 type I glyceraldehyde-3-phosphate dehydrogenase [Shewanella colwelliana]OEG72291.1 type I glyceraldehyde-3-phosphate dehydrogenase [Shewanella colwelliana]OEG75714.1 type I glyceraldehyde-3-phosphate dehydrogenase [Shewanella colwelliana]GIU32240.1 glyceraldehyde-3-phosphate dehydrogenase [Shewanella colwelliana]